MWLIAPGVANAEPVCSTPSIRAVLFSALTAPSVLEAQDGSLVSTLAPVRVVVVAVPLECLRRTVAAGALVAVLHAWVWRICQFAVSAFHHVVLPTLGLEDLHTALLTPAVIAQGSSHP